MSIRDGAHHFTVRVYYEDTDAGGVVYHANYLRFAERARTEALRELGVPHAEMQAAHGLIFMVRSVKLDYLAPARLDDSMTIATRPVLLRGASVELRQTFLLRESRIAEAELTLACVRAADGRPDRLPVRWRTALAALMAPPEAEGAGIEES
jgi:acyl-CoA thioester hydrolase